jgi:hypothetical protein
LVISITDAKSLGHIMMAGVISYTHIGGNYKGARAILEF